MLRTLSILLRQEHMDKQRVSKLKLQLTKRSNTLLLILNPREFRLPLPDLQSPNLNAQLWSKKLKQTKIAKISCSPWENSLKAWLSQTVSSDLPNKLSSSSPVNKVSNCSTSLAIPLTTLETEISRTKNDSDKFQLYVNN